MLGTKTAEKGLEDVTSRGLGEDLDTRPRKEGNDRGKEGQDSPRMPTSRAGFPLAPGRPL